MPTCYFKFFRSTVRGWLPHHFARITHSSSILMCTFRQRTSRLRSLNPRRSRSRGTRALGCFSALVDGHCSFSQRGLLAHLSHLVAHLPSLPRGVALAGRSRRPERLLSRGEKALVFQVTKELLSVYLFLRLSVFTTETAEGKHSRHGKWHQRSALHALHQGREGREEEGGVTVSREAFLHEVDQQVSRR